MKISIITPVINRVATIEDCLRSVHTQTYPDIEHIIIDGGSVDGTLDIINKYRDKVAKFISEPDNGIYDAMNKGIRVATGEVIGILNADDFYANEDVIKTVVERLEESGTDSCYGDLIYVNGSNPEKIVRYWKSKEYNRDNFKRGWMPPHPTFFCKKRVYEEYGLLNLDFPLSADYELMLRFLYKYRVSTVYIPRILIKMRVGGTSRPGLFTAKAILEGYRAWKVNGLDYPLMVLLKPLTKIFQFFRKTDSSTRG